MISTTPSLTNRGSSLLMRAIAGESITFTRFKIGDGRLSAGQSGAALNDLVHAVVTFPITDMDDSQTGLVAISGEFDSGDVAADFTWREIGIFAKGEDNVEVLYAYANDGDNAGVLKALNTEILTEQTVTLIIAIGEAEHVTAVFSPRQQYASKAEFDTHKESTTNPHNVTKQQVGLGNVPNLAPSDMTISFTEAAARQELNTGEKLSVLLGKLKKIVKDVIAHLSNTDNPHSVTRAQIGAAASSHSHAAGDIDSGTLGLDRGGTGVTTLQALKNMIGTNAAMGIYSGDGTVKRLISLDFQPSAVILCNEHGQFYDGTDGVCGGVAIGQYGMVRGDNSVAANATVWSNDYTALLIDEGGFYVNYKAGTTAAEKISTNTGGKTYHYIAYR